MHAGQLAQTMVSAEVKIKPLWIFGTLYASSSQFHPVFGFAFFFFSAAVKQVRFSWISLYFFYFYSLSCLSVEIETCRH